ncbi:MAG TPA: glucose-6-phosphate isomerase [Bdellovibrionota bacterium]|jgi:glucose-6-phosphate isomerase|nr:glucose-6-phosphate isomerase [Bdellovibrionota bacterium]
MSKLLSINFHGLNTHALKMAAPEAASPQSAGGVVRENFLAWTRDEKNQVAGKVYSGYQTSLLKKSGFAESKAAAQTLIKLGCDTLVIFGIGGSSLGAKCVYESLRLSEPLRKLIFLENIDPTVLHHTLESLEWKRTAFAVITKAGGTIETLAQFSEILSRAPTKLGAQWKDHFVAITDPEKGDLRKWVRATGITALSVPPEVGGRFSVFTPVGLLPLAFAGVDVDELARGALETFAGKVVPLTEIEELGQRLMDLYAQGSDTHVIMPYASSLKPLGDWCVQLIGESLGKLRSPQKREGLVPLAALGATDQHSLLQLLMEGPQKFVTHFVEIENWGETAAQYTFHDLPPEFTSLQFAYGKPLYEILNAELSATAMAMERSGRAYFKITLRENRAANLGALLAFYMDLVTYLGACLDINPYDQPGVELGKRILKEIFAD